jgi:hypothetical protein
MRLRPHRRTLVVWSSYTGPDRYGLPWFTQATRPRRIRRCIRTGALLTIIGLMRLARAVQADWRLALRWSGSCSAAIRSAWL